VAASRRSNEKEGLVNGRVGKRGGWRARGLASRRVSKLKGLASDEGWPVGWVSNQAGGGVREQESQQAGGSVSRKVGKQWGL